MVNLSDSELLNRHPFWYLIDHQDSLKNKMKASLQPFDEEFGQGSVNMDVMIPWDRESFCPRSRSGPRPEALGLWVQPETAFLFGTRFCSHESVTLILLFLSLKKKIISLWGWRYLFFHLNK